jgi:hypothetical protein
MDNNKQHKHETYKHQDMRRVYGSRKLIIKTSGARAQNSMCESTLRTCDRHFLVIFESTLRTCDPHPSNTTLNWSETRQIAADVDKNWCRIRRLFEEILNMTLPSQSEKCCILAKNTNKQTNNTHKQHTHTHTTTTKLNN